MELNKLIHGDCLEVMKDMEDNTIDTIITDPPYGLKFMGKKWDYDVPSVEIWQECLRVLKPGGTALIFAGSRTQHRMACNVEDAGFILKDCIMWIYGCLSDDTEVLTHNGFKRLHKTTKYDTILVYDNKTNIYKWETPQRWSSYKVNEHTCYHIESDKTNQIVSKEHTCLIERNGKLVCKQAWELHDMETMPYLSEDFFDEKENEGKLLFKDMLWKGENGTPEKHCSSFLCEHVERRKSKKIRENENSNDGFKKSSVERRCDLPKKERELCQSKNQIREMPSNFRSDGEERRLCDGTSSYNCNAIKSPLDKNRMCSSCEPQCRRQQDRKFNAFQNKSRPQEIRTRPEYKTTLATIKEIKYTGTLFCPTVSTGFFVARRNGKIFLTGNSGFPKATDISKQLDKKAGKLNTQGSGFNTAGHDGRESKMEQTLKFRANYGYVYDPGTEEAIKWNGWKSHGLKPAYEPILVCMKPNEGSYADNALNWGVAGLNIDGCRIPTEEKTNRTNGKTAIWNPKGNMNSEQGGGNLQGRFPANIIFDEESAAMLDEQTGKLHPSGNTNSNLSKKSKSIFNIGIGISQTTDYKDSGGASRFFYCAKASKKERNAGCEELGEKSLDIGDPRPSGGSWERRGRKKATPRANIHPTIKPIKLMEYLCTLTETPTGGTILDPFMGSGTTGVAAINKGRPFKGIERESEFVDIAKARIEKARIEKAEKRIKEHVIQERLF